jgi:2-iminobutanoate/2-iminopropanoate deaminase
MNKEIISTDKAPAAIGPYSQAVKIGNMIFTSGQIPLDLNGNKVSEDIQAQTVKVLDNLKAVLEAGGSNLDNVIKTTVFIKDMNQFGQINEIYGQYFTNKQPARSCVQVSRLPKDVDVEIEAVAVVE